jgi:putative tricarboxylic transport membrane protein
MNDRHGLRRGLIEARVAALAVIGLGVVSLVGASQVRPPAGYAAVSASVMPAVVGVGLVSFGILLLVRATVRPDLDHAARVAAEAAATHWPTTFLALGALVAYALVLGPLGYILATSLFLPAQARVLGSRSPLRDLIVGVAVAVIVYFVFTEFLGVRLSAGLLEPVLP